MPPFVINTSQHLLVCNHGRPLFRSPSLRTIAGQWCFLLFLFFFSSFELTASLDPCEMVPFFSFSLSVSKKKVILVPGNTSTTAAVHHLNRYRSTSSFAVRCTIDDNDRVCIQTPSSKDPFVRSIAFIKHRILLVLNPTRPSQTKPDQNIPHLLS